ncbi:hypothetical protein QJS10_CPA07g00283 [Acorus calamus]|uniref:Uncharacterized protein n=1 Tax=Acorus calamus TaxID=4465 RepID=A0AAV9EFH2_ACOCL|nr:hypothetical protein QJS10_CPA07g00283 [Acorus calamus]
MINFMMYALNLRNIHAEILELKLERYQTIQAVGTNSELLITRNRAAAFIDVFLFY